MSARARDGERRTPCAVRARAPPEHVGVSAHDFRVLICAREDLVAIWILAVSPYSPDLALCASAGEGGLVALACCTMLIALQAGKVHYKLARESGVADEYLCDPLCELQVLIDVDWAVELSQVLIRSTQLRFSECWLKASPTSTCCR
ncbi:hypothetical protein FB451DRAFT_1193487 [Mycena latifolia]|nr:hypothetical protein FB451DRAFT_1193487 [Mycena latifolia]